MIVIVIIGVVYALVISKVQTPQQNKKLTSFTTLRSYLQAFKKKDTDTVAVTCNKHCQTCTVTCNGIKVKEITPFFDASVQRYRYDYFEGLRHVEDGKCFALALDGDGVSSQYVITYKGKAYDFTNYFDTSKEYNSSEALSNAKANLIQVVSQ